MPTATQPKYHDLSDDPNTALAVGSPIALDTEGYVAAPWCLSGSIVAGTGFVIRRHGAGLCQFTEAINAEQPLTILHNALHDLPVLAALGVHPHRFTDTMLMAWLLGEEFIGLKKLAAKYLGKDRDSYRDVLEEANERIAREWLVDQLVEFPRWPGAKPPDLEKKLRLIDRMLVKDDPEGTLRERWKNCTAREFFEIDTGMIGPMPEATLDDVPLDAAVQYAGEDADDTLALYPMLQGRITATRLQSTLDADLAIVPMIVRMHEVGIPADVEHFQRLSVEFQHELDHFAGEIRAMGGPDKLGSPPEIAKWLFDDLKLPSRKKTKGGEPSTDKKVLEALVRNPRIKGRGRQGLELLMEWRQVHKLKTAYADPMPGFIKADGRVHPNLSLTRVPTGRLAAEDPNLLAQPKHSKRGLRIREGFHASPGRMLAEFDLSQIEMVVAAIDSGDERMIAELLSGVDKHTATAANMFKRDPAVLYAEYERDEEPGKGQRFAAKAVNFGIWMGITEYGLNDQFQKNGLIQRVEHAYNKITEEWENRRVLWTETACAALLDEWHVTYPQASTYIRDKHAEALQYGYVRSLLGRRYYIQDIDSEIEYYREEAKRQAQAQPIQGGAQELVRIWMREVWKRLPALRAQGVYVECLLQVHDALLFEFDEGAYEPLKALVQSALDELQMFPVPIKMKGKQGFRWSDL